MFLKQRTIETQLIDKQKQVELSQQDRDIAVAEKSKAQSEAKAEADKARALAVQAEEQVITVREKEIAERQKQIELIEATKEAEREAISIKVAAEADKMAAADRAGAMREIAQGEAEKSRIIAAGEAEAIKFRAQADEMRYSVEAAGKRSLNEAANLLSPEQIAMQIKVKLIENLDSIIRESVKPMERIDDIKIIQVQGLGASVNGGTETAAGNNGNLADQVVNSALRYRAQAPLLDSLLKEVGLNGQDINGLTQSLQDKDDN